MTGDLTDFGRADEYAVLAPGIARLGKPAYLMPGNHDEHAGLCAAFTAHDYLSTPHADAARFIQYRIELSGTAFVALDNVVP